MMTDHTFTLSSFNQSEDRHDDLAHPAIPRGGSPLLSLENITVRKSNCSEFRGLQVRLCDPPSLGHVAIIDSRAAWLFPFLPHGSKGMRLRISALGTKARPNRRDNLLLISPGLRAQVEWIHSAGRIAIFSLMLNYIEKLAERMGLPAAFPTNNSLDSLTIDRQFEALCQLLVEETEENCLHGPLYFEALAQALALRLFRRARDWQLNFRDVRTHAPGTPPGIRAAIRRLEDDFSDRILVSDLARIANLSIDHFACAFRKATGSTPHQYLLHVRLSHARKLMTQKAQAISLADIALACGFADQTHFSRHFRRFFGMTPTAFLRTTER